MSFFQLKKSKTNKTFIAAFMSIGTLIIIEQSALFSALSLKYQQHQKIPTLADFSLKNEILLWSEGEIIANDSKKILIH